MDGLHLSSAVHKLQWDFNPNAPTAIRLRETVTFLPFALSYQELCWERQA